MANRTFVIGDIHGELPALERLLTRMEPLTEEDTVVFLGDYVDRGPNSRGVIERVQRFCTESPTHSITLRGNHEDKWIQSFEKPDLPYLVQQANGCGATFRSFIGGAPLPLEESLSAAELPKMLEVDSWLPWETVAWMAQLRLYYEDEHALYVHAGLDGKGEEWKHPSDSAPKPLLWMRDPGFFANYKGKRVVVGHTPTDELPVPGDPPARGQVWLGPTISAIDTGCGRGGPLTALELPTGRIVQSTE
jgi:serine/threonine protein phosphatase 1